MEILQNCGGYTCLWIYEKNHWIVCFSWMNCMAYEFSLIDKALLTTTKKIVLHVCKFIINLFYLQVVITSHLALKIIFSLVLCKYNITELWFGLFILCLYLIAKSLLTVILSLYLITIYFTLNQVTYKSFLKSFQAPAR